MTGELSITLQQCQEGVAENRKLQNILRQNMDLCNKLSAARMRIIKLEDLLMAIELDDEEGRLAASDEVKKQLKDELRKIPQQRRKAFVDSLPYKDKQALWNFQERMQQKGKEKARKRASGYAHSA